MPERGESRVRHPCPRPPGSAFLGRAQGAPRYFFLARPVAGGEILELCASGGWLVGRFEWDVGMARVPTFFFSVELDGGGVAQLSIAIPERALFRWPTPRSP